MIRKHFRFKRLVIGFALAAIVAPTAQASDGALGVLMNQIKTGPQHSRVASEMSVQSTPTALQVEGMRWQAMADTYARLNPVRSENSFGSPGPSAGGAQGPSAVHVVATSSGFNWGDAGIGASITFAAGLLLASILVLGRRSGRSRPGSLARA